MDTEQLKIIVDALEGVGEDAKNVVIVYFIVPLIEVVLKYVFWLTVEPRRNQTSRSTSLK